MGHHNQPQRMTLCIPCKHTNSPCALGQGLMENLRRAIEAAGPAVAEDFEISGTACMANCSRPCTLAYHGSRQATYVFGDVDPEADIADLVALARQHTGAETQGLRPAAVMAMETLATPLH